MDKPTEELKKITKPCPNSACRKKVWLKFTFHGEGDGETKCPHCGKRLKVVITQKAVVTFTLIAIILIVVVLNEAVIAEKISCASFKTWEDAQKHYQPKLDHNHNGSACDKLK